MAKLKNKKLNADEILHLINKQWANRQDVKLLGYIGDNKSYEVMQDIRKIVQEKGYTLPKELVPMEAVVDYFKININYLKKVRSKNL